MNQEIEHLLGMSQSKITNYVLPGLESYILGRTDLGCTRLFRNTRTQLGAITPHSHRFDFSARVLQGWVRNKTWHPSSNGDIFAVSKLGYLGTPGEYSKNWLEAKPFVATEKTYHEGDTYFMTSDEIHSIVFSKDAVVLFFEGETTTDSTLVLEPFVDGELCQTLNIEKWMFKRS